MEKQRREILKRLKQTRRNETICLMGWETEILVAWIEDLKARDKENAETVNHREPDQGS